MIKLNESEVVAFVVDVLKQVIAGLILYLLIEHHEHDDKD